MKRLLIGALSAFVVIACAPREQEPVLALGVDLEAFDQNVRPQDDFYLHVNGTWLASTEIPADKATYGSFGILRDLSEERVNAIIEEAANARDKIAGSDLQRVGDFYLSYMDEAKIAELGLTPLAKEMERIDDIGNRDDLVRYIGYNQSIGVSDPFLLFTNLDYKDTTKYTVYLHHSGLGLPDRDYYFDEEFADKREKYLAFVQKILDLAGIGDSADKAQMIMDLETRLAEAHWTRVENRQREKTYNPFTVAEANELTPGLDWNLFLEGAGMPDRSHFVLRQPSYFTTLGAIIKDVSVRDWRTYFRYNLLRSYAQYLTEDFVAANFDFYGKTLSGTEEIRPRWKRAVETADELIGEVLGRIYVDRHFQPESKVRMDEMIENLRRAFEIAIKELKWMGDGTKAEARAKLAKFVAKIGYPNKWRDYTGLNIVADDLVGNVIRGTRFEYDRKMKQLRGPVDRDEWRMTPQTINAYYNPTMNEIVFPAAILQPPFFNVEADDATNYGAIGAVIGHEFSHGFDDQGRKTDGDGLLRDWWTEQDAEQFKERSGALVAQYDALSPIEGMNVQGELTLGENIGDLAGLTMAYKAYKLSLGDKEAPVIDGYTGDQRFFLGWAQVWRRLYRDDELKRRLRTDPHSPSQYRVNGIVRNMPEWYAAFDVKEGDALYLPHKERVKIW